MAHVLSPPVGHDAPAKPSPAFDRVILLLGFSVLINYIDRSNLSIAAPLLKDELHFSPNQLGLLLSAFFWTYTAMQLISGWLVDRFDVKWVFGMGFLVWSLATAVTGFMHGFATLITLRIIVGIGESVAFPSYSKIIANHVPRTRRGYANSVVWTGLALGPATGLFFGGPLVAHLGWRPFFIGLGLLSILWLVPWFSWMPPTPSVRTKSDISFLDVLRQRSALGTCLGLLCANYNLYFMVTWLPYYLVRDRHFSLTDMAKIGGSLFLLSGVCGLITGRLTDRWIAAGASPTHVLKRCIGWGTFFLGLMVAPVPFVSRPLSVVFLLLTGVAMGVSSATVWNITQRLAGIRAVGRWCGVQLVFGSFAGILASALTGFLLQRTGNFHLVFLTVAAFVWTGLLGWILMIGNIEPVTWPGTGEKTLAAMPEPLQASPQ